MQIGYKMLYIFRKKESSACILPLMVYTVSQKRDPTLSIVTLRRIDRFSRFFAQIFLTQLAIKWLFKFPPHPTSVSTLPGKTELMRYYIIFIQGSIINLLK